MTGLEQDQIILLLTDYIEKVIKYFYICNIFENSRKATSQEYWSIILWIGLVPFLCIGITNDIFHRFGISANAKEQLKITDKAKNYSEIA